MEQIQKITSSKILWDVINHQLLTSTDKSSVELKQGWVIAFYRYLCMWLFAYAVDCRQVEIR